MQINFVYDSSVNSAPSGFTTALNAAAAYLDSLFINPITINIQVGWDEIQGQPLSGGAIGEASPNQAATLSYSQVRQDLAANSTSSATATAVASLPATNPTRGGVFAVSSAQEKAFGLLPANDSAIDGAVGFGGTSNFNFNPNDRAIANEIDFVGVAEHEITHAMGRVEGLQEDGPGQYSIMDLFRYASSGNRQLGTGLPAYFSINGGKTDLDNYDVTSDLADWAASNGPDSFNAYASAGVENPVTQSDITEMNVIGFAVSGSSLPTPLLGAVTVTGIGGATITLPMDTSANAQMLQPLLTAISNSVTGGTVLVSGPNSPPAIPPGDTGMLQISSSTQVTIPGGYLYAIVDSGSPVSITGGSANGQLIAAGQGGLNFSAGAGAGSVFAGGGNNLVNVGSSGGSQYIALGNGRDTIAALGGSNSIIDGTGSGLIFLGSGLNTVQIGGADTVVAGTGRATVSASGANSLLFGNFTSNPGALYAVATGALATISAGNSATSVSTAGSNGLVYGSFGSISGGLSEMDTGQATTVYAGNFGAAATLDGGDALVYGDFTSTPGALSLVDGGTSDTISAASSAINATLRGSQALLFGGYGNIAGGLSIVDTGQSDTIATGNSNANIVGGNGGSGLLVFGGTGTLNFAGGSGSATVVPGIGSSTVSGGRGGTTLYGSAGGNIALSGNQGLVYAAGAGNETLNGTASFGNNELAAGSGSDVILGGHGDDTLFAEAGAATLAGGGGPDIFAFFASLTHGNAVAILDFNTNDSVYLSGYGANQASIVLSNASSSNGNTVITLADHTQVTFIGVSSASTLQGHVFSF